MREQQKGLKVNIAYTEGGPSTTFTAGGRKRYPIGNGMVAVNGTIKFADGTFAYAVLEIDESSSGEHHGTGIFLLDGDFVFQDDPDFLKKLHKTAAEVFPYTYRYDAEVQCEDHHVGIVGWSF